MRLLRRGATGRWLAGLLAAAALAACGLAGGDAALAQDRRGPPDVDAEAAIVVDAASGAVIAAENPKRRLPIASATKLMTALLTLERSRPGEVLQAADYVPDPVESQIGLMPGERMAARDLLVALLLESANDAAVTLAEGIDGSTGAFVARMNERAGDLGLDDTSYANPIGFDDGRNYSTATDLAALGTRLMEERRFREIVEEPELELESGEVPRVVDNRNDLVGEAPFVDGIKTGQTREAGHVLVGSAADDGNRVVSVVLGAPSEGVRDAASLELLRFGLDQFVERRVLRAGEIVASAAVAHGGDERVGLAAAEGVSVTALRGEQADVRIEAPEEVEGPLGKGEDVGSVAVVTGSEVVRRVPLVTAAPVPGADLTTRVATTLRDHLGVVAAVAVILCGLLVLAALFARRRRVREGTRSAT